MQLAIISSNDIFSRIALSKLYRDSNYLRDINCHIKINTPPKLSLRLFFKGLLKSPLYISYLLYEKYLLYKYSTLLCQHLPELPNMDLVIDNINSLKTINYLKSKQIDTVLFIRPLQIINKNFLDHFPNSYNLHNTMLPKYRGLGGVFQTLRHNDDYIGITVHKVTNKLDGGDIVKQDKLLLKNEFSLFEITLHSYLYSSKVLLNFIDELKSNRLNIVHQNNTEASSFSWPKFTHFVDLSNSKYRLFGSKHLKDIIESSTH